VMYLNL